MKTAMKQLADYKVALRYSAVGVMALSVVAIYLAKKGVLYYGVDVISFSFCLFGAAAVVAVWCRWTSWVPRALVLVFFAVNVYFGLTVFSFRSVYYRAPVLTISQVQVRSLFRGLDQYHRRFGGYPSELREVIEQGMIDEVDLHSPFRRHLPPTEQRIDYVYVSGLSKDDPRWWPIAFDREDIHADGMRTVLQLSGEPSTLNSNEFIELIKRFAKSYMSSRSSSPLFVIDGVDSNNEVSSLLEQIRQNE